VVTLDSADSGEVWLYWTVLKNVLKFEIYANLKNAEWKAWGKSDTRIYAVETM